MRNAAEYFSIDIHNTYTYFVIVTHEKQSRKCRIRLVFISGRFLSSHTRVSSASENIALLKQNFGPSRFSANLQAAWPLKRLGMSSSLLIYGRITEQTLSLRIPLPSARTFANCDRRKTLVANALEPAILVNYSGRANFLFDEFFLNAGCNLRM